MFRNSFVIRTSSSPQLSSGFDWSEESKIEGKTQNNKREHEDDDESSDSEMQNLKKKTQNPTYHNTISIGNTFFKHALLHKIFHV